MKSFLSSNQQFLFLAILSVLLSVFLNKDDFQDKLVEPYDARGYYAYLPALLIYEDPSYEKVLEAEKNQFQGRDNQYYLFKSKKGRKYNKYFPGVSLMQAPFFITAMTISKLIGSEVNGYSFIFMLLTYIGALFYTILGLYFLYKVVMSYTNNKNLTVISIFIVFFGTQLFFYTIAKPTLSHNYSFFLFAFLFYVFQNYSKSHKAKSAVLIGVILGLIFLIRPTNILIALFLPFFLIKKETIISFFKFYFKLRNYHLLLTVISFLSIASILLFLSKWQTGEWLIWSYKGEVLDLTNPYFFSSLFSYRIGLFVHAPILIVCFSGWWLMYKKQNISALIWMTYFTITVYVVSSWWCWDYESEFGHRALAEHLVIFVFPLTHLLNFKKFKWITYSILLVGLLYLFMRFYQKQYRIFPQQKFTQFTYWKSMGDFDPSPEIKYYSLTHCAPIGGDERVVKKQYKNDELKLDEGAEFTKRLVYHFDKNLSQGRLFIKVNFDKKLLDFEDNWHDVLIVFDAINEITGERIYFASPIYEYYKEGLDGWHKTQIEHDLYAQFQRMQKVYVYIWNKSRKRIGIKDFEVTFYEIE
ncbi:MAG: hypothetical protein WEA99_05925 [Brumimicrobium sp.]